MKSLEPTADELTDQGDVGHIDEFKTRKIAEEDSVLDNAKVRECKERECEERLSKARTSCQLALIETRAREDDVETNDDDRSNRTLRTRTTDQTHGPFASGARRQTLTGDVFG